MTRICIVLAIALVATSITAAEGTGTAVVQVTTRPDVGTGTFRFTGTPAGELTLVTGEQSSLTAPGLAPGIHASILEFVDPAIVSEGYTLTDITCDDRESAEPSSGAARRPSGSRAMRP